MHRHVLQQCHSGRTFPISFFPMSVYERGYCRSTSRSPSRDTGWPPGLTQSLGNGRDQKELHAFDSLVPNPSAVGCAIRWLCIISFVYCNSSGLQCRKTTIIACSTQINIFAELHEPQKKHHKISPHNSLPSDVDMHDGQNRRGTLYR